MSWISKIFNRPSKEERVPEPAIKPASTTKLFTKEELAAELHDISARGWLVNPKPQHDGTPGDMLEALLGIPTNNLPIADASGWELKTQRQETTSLISLSHKEPKPREERIVPRILLPLYGWRHDKAGILYPVDEMSFRMTMNGATFTDRGFKFNVNREQHRIEIVFDSSRVSPRHKEWLNSVEKRVGLGPLPVTPYYDFTDLYLTIGRKFLNTLFVKYETKKENGISYVHYNEAYFLEEADIEKFIEMLDSGIIKIEFDARTGHNHGTKFRMYFRDTPSAYKKVVRIM